MAFVDPKAEPLDVQAFALTLNEVKTIRWALLVLRAHPERGGAELSYDEIVELERKFFWN